MPTPRFNYTPRWVVDAQKAAESSKRQREMVRSISAPLPPQLPPDKMTMRNNPDPTDRIGSKLGWLGQDTEAKQTGIQQMGLHLLSNMGPRPQGTFDTLSNFAQAAGFGINAYKQAQLENTEKDQLARMTDLQSDPDILATLSPERQKLIQSLPPAKAAEVLTSVMFNTADQKSLITQLDPGNNQILLMNPLTGDVVRRVPMGKEQKNLSFQTTGDGTLLGLDPQTGEEVVRLSTKGQDDVATRELELRNNWESKGPVKVWQESEVQLRAAQRAAAATNGSADLSLMIAAAKILDPNSVVREGEIGLQDMAASKNDQIRGLAKQWFTNDGRLSDTMRTNILNTVERTAQERWNAFEQEKAHLMPIYSQFQGVDSQRIFGSWTTPSYVTMSNEQPGAANIPPNPYGGKAPPIKPGVTTGRKPVSRYLPSGG
jgi:hypothetical protein